MGLWAGGEGDETQGSPIRERKFGVRARPCLKSWGLNLGISNRGTSKAWAKFYITDVGVTVGPACSAGQSLWHRNTPDTSAV